MSNHPIMSHPQWPLFRQWMIASVGAQNQWHIRVRPDTPPKIKRAMREIILVCHCKIPYHPIRSHSGNDSMALMATGPRHIHTNCSHKKAGREWIDSAACDIIKSQTTNTSTFPQIDDTVH